MGGVQNKKKSVFQAGIANSAAPSRRAGCHSGTLCVHSVAPRYNSGV